MTTAQAAVRSAKRTAGGRSKRDFLALTDFSGDELSAAVSPETLVRISKFFDAAIQS